MINFLQNLESLSPENAARALLHAHETIKQNSYGKRCRNAQCENIEKTTGTVFKQCSGCHSAKYCSVACQKKDWKYHKNWCPGKKTLTALDLQGGILVKNRSALDERSKLGELIDPEDIEKSDKAGTEYIEKKVTEQIVEKVFNQVKQEMILEKKIAK